MTPSRRVRVLELRSVRGTGRGPEKTILLGAAQADRERFDVLVCYIRDRRDDVFSLGERARSLGVEYIDVEERNSFDPRILSQLRRIVIDREIDIVHAHEYKTDLVALALSRRSKVLPLATAHGWTGQSPRERFLYYPADKWLLARYPRVIAVSSEIKTELVRCGCPSDGVTVVLNGIDPSLFRRDPRRRDEVRQGLGLAPSDFVIGAVGRLERQKRFDLLLEAFETVAKVDGAVRLMIVGDGALADDLRQQSGQLGLQGRCQFLGHRTDVANVHHAFDLFVQSSEYEGTPNAVLEAMAMETPVVATDVGGTGELLFDGHHGRLVPPGDVGRLSEAIVDAKRRITDFRVMAQAARARVESELSFAARTRRVEQIYAELAHA